MRKMVIALIAVVWTVAPAAAAGRFSLTGGYALGTRAMIGGGPAVELSFEIPVSRSLSFEIVSGYFQASAKDDPTGLRAGTVRIVPLEAGLRIRTGLSRSLSLFAAAGAGLSLPFSSLDPDLAAAWEAVGFAVEEKLDPSFSASARCGLEAELNPGIGLVLQAGYRFFRAGGSWSILDDLDRESAKGEWSGLSLDHFFFGLGLSFGLGR